MTAVSVVIIAMTAMAVPTVRAQSPPAEDLFIRASVDNERPYLGQQITYSFRVYRKKDADLSILENPTRISPNFAGFWNSREAESEREETIGSSEYLVVEVQTVLFPTVAGARDIEPTVLGITVRTSNGTIIQDLESPPVALEVRPLPVPQMAGFTGAVGRLDITASVDAAEGDLNEPVLLTIAIAGEGNIEALPDPEWPAFPGWRVIESPVSVESRLIAGQIAGSRTYRMTLMPEQSGELTIPEVRYPYFDPALEQFVELATAPIVVSIADEGASPAAPAIAASVEEDPQVRPIKAAPSSLRQAGPELAHSPAYWAAWAIPALAIAGAVAWRRRQRALDASRAEARRRSALPDAQAALSRAVASGSDPRVAASEALLAYVAARLETPVGGLTLEAVIRRLREAGVPLDLEDRAREALAAGESARYIPPGSHPGGAGNYAQQTSQLLDELEEAIGA